MAEEISFVLVNPYTIAKSRTGGVVSRIISRTGLELVGARMFAPSAELARKYADLLRESSDGAKEESDILADYVLHAYAPDAKTGKRHRVFMLVFQGENAIKKIADTVGSLRPSDKGETVRDTFGDYVLDENGKVVYVEPGVMTGHTKEKVASMMKLWAEYSDKDGGLVTDAVDVGTGANVQKTLVILKPDNFKFASSRPGNILDIFSASGLRIICAKVHRMSVAEAEEFYGPVKDVLRNKLKGMVSDRAVKVLTTEFSFEIPADAKTALGDVLGPIFGDDQFENIIEFMTGYRPSKVAEADKKQPGKERCLILVYTGANAVDKIRKILGPTDPSKAEPGSVRKEYGKSIMVNAAHASDSAENAQREMKIVKVEKDTIKDLVHQYFN